MNTRALANSFKTVIYIKPTLLIIAANLLLMITIILLQKLIPPVVPLLYGKPTGEEQLTSRANLLIPPVLAIATNIINLALIQILKDNFLQKILLSLGFILTILSTITTLKIIFLIGNL